MFIFEYQNNNFVNLYFCVQIYDFSFKYKKLQNYTLWYQYHFYYKIGQLNILIKINFCGNKFQMIKVYKMALHKYFAICKIYDVSKT